MAKSLSQSTSIKRANLVDAANHHSLDKARQAALIKASQQGDAAAFRALYESHKGRVYAVVYRLIGDADEAKDVTQDVFVQVWKSLKSFRGESAFSTWLHRVATNITISHIRKRKHWWQRFVSDNDQELPEASTTMALPDDRLEVAILGLPEQARMVFVLFAVEGYKHEEIASLLGIAVGSSKAQYFRARKLLREKLDHE